MSDSGEGHYPLDDVELYSINCIAKLFSDNASSMSPRVMRSASVLLLALRRMPLATPGIDLCLGFATPNRDGNWSWVDVEISGNEFRLGLGHHFYDPSVGGDTECATVFEAFAGSGRSAGSMDEWLESASGIAGMGHPSLNYDNSDHDILAELFDDEDPD